MTYILVTMDSITFSSFEAVYVYLACKLISDTLDRNSQIIDKTFLSALEGLTQGWIRHELLRLEYNSPNQNKARIYDVSGATVV